MKKLFLLTITSFLISIANAQFKSISPFGPMNDLPNSYTKINTKAIVQKMGKEQLLKLFTTANVKNELKANQKLAIAALFNNAIDIEKPIWIKPNNNVDATNYFLNRQTAPLIIIPIKNKAKAIDYLKIITNAKDEIEVLKKLDKIKSEYDYYNSNENGILKTVNTTTYFISNNQNVIVDDKNIYIVQLKHNNIFNEFVPGKIIKTDSVAYEKPIFNESNNQKEKTDEKFEIVEIDKIENGKVIRMYQHPTKKRNDYLYDTARPIINETSIDDSTSVNYGVGISVDTVRVTIGETASFDTAKAIFTDTITEVDEIMPPDAVATATAIEEPNLNKPNNKENSKKYITLENGKSVSITYKPFTQNKLVVESKKYLTKQITKITGKLNESVKIANAPLPESAVKEMQINQLDEENADVVTIKKLMIGNMFSALTNKRFIAAPITNENNQAYSVGVTNFENGKAITNQQFNCCDEYAQLTKDMFNPHTGDYLNVNNEAPMMSMAYNINISAAKNYYEKIGLISLLEKQMKINTSKKEDLLNVFSGGILLSVNFEGKVPSFNLALKIKDAEKAIPLFNKLNSKNLDMTHFYRFSADGGYLFYSISPLAMLLEDEGLPNFDNWKIEKNKNLGHLGYMNLDMNNMVKAMEKTKIKDEDEKADFDKRMVLFKSLNASANFIYKKNENGVIQSEGTINMGNANTNFLKSMVQFIQDMANTKRD